MNFFYAEGVLFMIGLYTPALNTFGAVLFMHAITNADISMV